MEHCDIEVNKPLAIDLAARSMPWVHTEANKKNKYACFFLGIYYFHGIATSLSNGRACAEWRNACAAGYSPAQYWLGSCYEFGRGVSQDWAAAVRLYRKSAEQGYPAAQCKLGGCYYFGWDGSGSKEEKGIRWFKLAARQGYQAAKDYLKDHLS